VTEPPDRRARQDAFLRRLQDSGLTVVRVASPVELELAVSQALVELGPTPDAPARLPAARVIRQRALAASTQLRFSRRGHTWSSDTFGWRATRIIPPTSDSFWTSYGILIGAATLTSPNPCATRSGG
jgi:hypothetical protein